MLAYVFWHWPRAAVPISEYEQRQRRFHDALLDAPPPGFERSTCHNLVSAPWANDLGQAYEDWYLIRDSAALDPLNEAAVTGRRRAPHDEAAAAAAGGTAGVYRLRLGAPPVTTGHELWFPKPDGMSYESLWTTLAPIAQETRGALWSRYMVLGPSPEFCLQTAEPGALPPGLAPIAISLRQVWPDPGAAR